MPQAPYIPTKDADFDNWLTNFSTLLTATPTAYGLVAGDATIVAAAKTAWHSAYLLATNPTTRTSPNIAAKDAQRASATATVQPYAQTISRNAGISDALKLGIGVNLPNTSRTPVPPPTTAPVLAHVASIPGLANIGYADTATPASKAKPFGAVAMELRQTIGTAIAVSPDDAKPVQNCTKSPTVVLFDSGDVGKIVTLWGRWITKSGPGGIAQVGPWSTSLSFAII
jgi:hypothetical protein